MAETGIIIQARMGSTRLPGKVLEDLAGAPALLRLFERLLRVKSSRKIVLATSTLPGDDLIARLVSAQACVDLWRGPEKDVLKRYAEAARRFDIDPIVRITADCPLIEPQCIENVIAAYVATAECAYADNLKPRTFPHGFDVQVVSRAALEAADAEAVDAYDREHVMPFVTSRPARFPAVHVVSTDASHADMRLTMDYPEDLNLIRSIYERFYPDNPSFGLAEILELRRREPGLFDLNRKYRVV